ncbi:alpha/beta hydrolase [Robertkochia marina]|uniref:Alpha/beta hydrolase n=1 Tax=Robertkochia marina TaxID=1227945 RepID=A0A4S3M300_9FLAO|nr:alpha/beta hydrolase [Robertkochia marina]THD67999.1 alpha/beta hydrolase [Robertkochia marina]TRZ41505.1 alpha/beta hydrolase [Robertkochia marina]
MPDQMKDRQPQEIQVPAFIAVPAKLLQWISPALAARFAAKIFGKPFKHKMPKREFEMDQESEQNRLIVPKIGKEVMVYQYGKSDRKVLLVHGWSGRGTQLCKIADALLKQGYATVSFDAPAHGKAKGKYTHMLEFVEAVLFLEREYGPFEVAVGHSLGGMSILNSIKRGAVFQKAVLIGSGNMVSEIMKDFIQKLGLKPITGIQMKRYFDEVSGIDTDTLSAEKVAPEIDIPVLVIHDEDDLDVPVHAGHRIHEHLPNSQLMITEGLGHRKVLGDKKVIEAIIDFMPITI